MRTYTIEAPRGTIYDANGAVLAESAERVNVAVNQQEIINFEQIVDGEVVATGPAAAADLLAPILGMDEAELGGMMVGEDTWVYLARDVLPTTWRQIRELNITGIQPEWISVREYPNGNTAGNIIGFVGTDHYGLAGLEASYDSTLAGVPGSETVEIGMGGQVIPTGNNEITDAIPGSSMNLSIDRDLQYLGQQLVDDVVARYGADWACVVMMEVGTGRLIVMADSNAVNPNDPAATPESGRGSHCVSSPYEPGSTGKLLTMSVALNEGAVTPTSVFTVPDQITLNNETFSDLSTHQPLDMTTTGILAVSSNVGSVMVGDLVPPETRYEYMQQFGFGQPTHLGLPAESSGILTDPSQWDRRSIYTTMFGQAYAVTAVQNVAMVATLANDGVYVEPTIIDSIVDADGNVTTPEVAPEHRVVSPETAQSMLEMMQAVTSEGGSGTSGAIPGYLVSAKTGTAQTADANGNLTQVVSNYVGIVPADNPRFAIAVVAYKPDTGIYGGVVGGPVFQQLAQEALTSFSVAPSTQPPANLPWAADGSTSLDY